MKTFIALFRGINVGGNNKLPMKELVTLLEGLGLKNPKTYIQSGNVVFQGNSGGTEQLAKKIGTAINQRHGFEPWVLLIDAAVLEKVIKSNPYPDAEAAPNTLYVNFLASPPHAPDLTALEMIKTSSERFQLIGNVCYLHAPDGIGRSKLAARMERLLGVPMTSRNWNTLCKLRVMVAGK